MNFAANLRRLRKAAKMTQEELAHACGYPGQSRIGNYEAEGEHRREPPLSDIPVIAKALGVPIAALFAEEPSEINTSHAARLDPNTLAETARALRERYEQAGRVFSIEEDPETYVVAYELCLNMADEPTPSNLVAFGMKLADLTPQGAQSDERSTRVPVEGTTRPKAGKAGRRKA